MKAKTLADCWQYEPNSTRAQYTRWQYSTPLDHRKADFVENVRYFTKICLNVNHDPRRDRYYPRLVRSRARAARVVRTLPHCRENHRRRRDLMMRLFDDDMEQKDVCVIDFQTDMCISLRIGLTTSQNQLRLRGRILHLFIGSIIANMLHFEIPKLTLTIISVE